jgi:hypothetical protein
VSVGSNVCSQSAIIRFGGAFYTIMNWRSSGVG